MHCTIINGLSYEKSRKVKNVENTNFDQLGHLKLLKELFVDIWGIPRGHPKSKPFVDRIMAFYYADKKVRKSHVNVYSSIRAND